MEGTMAEIRLFAGNFAPKTWALCYGQTLAISTNQALFSLLGTTYGGNGVTTFQLPDFRGRIPVGTGSGQTVGMGTITSGQKAGIENVTLFENNLPAHVHQVSISGTLPLTVSKSVADKSTVIDGLSLAAPARSAGRAKTPTLGYNSQTGSISLNPASIDLSGMTLALAPVGNTIAHNNLQPALGLNYIICLQGIYPSRN
ncbi:phage tail protein [Sphingobacterium spiritivorum]|uniref:Phage Tail Collar Domain protein n=1 Tax=Sphingobacterium spiritivorum ATCC 33861 TaxID=525373 RepID=D7VLV7_SPHSI|nr:tail fiber protein [Sphingobacterium spiritivorum]EFK57962.1 phage Tail Collar Domain protein [Sphingobacterium spiritivorum ATCC 33861]QQT34771.1 phage tail protein [Sphingobacterium spiritivorum]WQD35659.1 tail fiber protein [Sphingobacterium spiritivorum]SUJ01246.1 Phage Tail Collar Domain [Sphingobacterium spiritivorum]